jgi:hypothetical protein
MLDFVDLWKIERTKNIAANGRLFNALMFALVVVVSLHIDRSAIWLGLFPVLSIGAAYISDLLRWPWFGVLSPAFAALALAVVFYI